MSSRLWGIRVAWRIIRWDMRRAAKAAAEALNPPEWRRLRHNLDDLHIFVSAAVQFTGEPVQIAHRVVDANTIEIGVWPDRLREIGAMWVCVVGGADPLSPAMLGRFVSVIKDV